MRVAKTAYEPLLNLTLQNRALVVTTSVVSWS